jgi:membrane-anchored protein YejM (alkaline phosphatase superfamily)
MQNKTSETAVFIPFLAISFLFLLLNTSLLLFQAKPSGAILLLFTMAAYLSYSFLYFLPVIVTLWGLKYVLFRRVTGRLLNLVHIKPTVILYMAAVVLTGFLQILIFADGFIYRLYSFHINGFVWNLVFTPGGIESMGGSTESFIAFGMIIVGFLLWQSLILFVLIYFKSLREFCLRFFTRKRVAFAVCFLLALMLVQSIGYGVSKLYAYVPVLTASEAFPLYQPLTFNKLAKSMGIKPKETVGFRLKQGDIHLRYPLSPIEIQPGHKRYNIVWLVAESLRGDMLNPEVMPETWAFSEKAVRFEHHYGSANGTRQSLFSMFYGLYGNYWFSFLNERKGPVIMDVLLKEGYQMRMFSSARFSYPEFDKTIFAQVPREWLNDMETLPPGPSWQRDRQNVSRLLDFLNKRQPDRPFMTFMFFESPHARYYFPPESVIWKPYLDDFNYATMNLKRDIGLIKNRYLNSCRHLDSQYGRILKYLEERKLLDSTIVILTGDHGEEFMEKGHWGHNSTFNEEQTRTPLVLSIPGEAPRKVERMTSHMDIVATLLPLLGVTTRPENYSLGSDLLGPETKHYTIMGDWSTLAYVDKDYKATFGYTGISMNPKVTTQNDTVVENPGTFYQTHRQVLMQVMKELTHFSK